MMALAGSSVSRGDFDATCAASSNAKVSRHAGSPKNGERYDNPYSDPDQRPSSLLLSLLLLTRFSSTTRLNCNI